ncbi:chorismate mutase [Streptomyces sp. SID8379]|uniref:chorismate mutase n=1 Tax=unclassified Streptomyces TaxID=2593676 RepID=UPI000362936C|nr:MULTISPECIES: chorismate mutase [unclassified Streptomyces]MYW64137.1 chorismate mutase [Streptomyces sp. SID8379]
MRTRTLVIAATAVLALGGAAVPAAATTSGAPTAAAAHVEPRALTTVSSLAAERLALADKVAAAKYGTSTPIDDPARERQVLDDVAARSAGLGLDPAYAQAVFRDQIEANKVVQRGLYARWDAHPGERPAERPDLATEVRPALDRITGELLGALRDARAGRGTVGCAPVLVAVAGREARLQGFDALHRAGLARALPSVCADRP